MTVAAAIWLRLACRKSVVRRAVLYAVVVGSILTAINHGDAMLHGDVDMARLLRIALTVMVPYIVTTMASVEALREAARVEPPAVDAGLPAGTPPRAKDYRR